MIEITQEKVMQNCGIGSSLMEWCVRIAKSREMESIKLEVACDNTSAQNFYKKHGFIVVGNGTEDSLYMMRSIEKPYQDNCNSIGGGS